MEQISLGLIARFKGEEGIALPDLIAFRAVNFMSEASSVSELFDDSWKLESSKRIKYTLDTSWIDVELTFTRDTKSKVFVVTFSGHDNILIGITELSHPLADASRVGERFPFSLTVPSFGPELTASELEMREISLRRNKFAEDILSFFEGKLYSRVTMSTTSEDTVSRTTSDTTSQTTRGTTGTTTPNDEDEQVDNDVDHQSDSTDDHATDTHDDPDE